VTSRARTKTTDREARDRIVRDLDTTFLIEAGAGSGKTKSLVDRMIALLAAGRAGIETLAAVTFTRKAAAELRGRFQVELERARPAAKDPAVRARLDAALTGLERSFIGTIHSFCSRLLRERPVEAGVDPEFRELEEHEDRVLLKESWDEYLAQARLENEEALRGLEEAGLEPSELEEAFEALALFPDVEAAPGRPAPPYLGPARQALGRFLDLAQKLVPAERPEKGRDPLQTALVRAFRRRRNLGLDDDRRLMATIELFEREPSVTKIRWAPADDPAAIAALGRAIGEEAVEQALRKSRESASMKPLAHLVAETAQARAEAFRESVVLPTLRAWREFRHTKALAFLRPAVGFYERRRRAGGRLNFQDQLLVAASLLRDNPEVRDYFRGRFHPVLVDEFQDTDPIQAEILFLLTGEAHRGARGAAARPAERDWTKLVPAPGSLFLVGDPKQSIYRFRRADIDIYKMVQARIEAGGGETLRLSANFRSLRPIADWINPLFDPARGGLFPAKADAYQAGFIPLETVRPARRGNLAGVRKVTVPAVRYHAKESIVAHDAGRVACFLSWALSGGLELDDGRGGRRPAEPGDVLVLFRTKDRMNRYARLLEQRGIPFEISGSDAFSDNSEIEELLNLLRALDDPDDPVAVVAALRGLFFGLSDQDLLEHRAAGGSFLIGEKAVQERGPDKVRRALATLRAWRETTAKLPPSAALEAVLQESGLLNHLVTSEMGGSRAGNVLKLVEVLRGRESEDMTTFAAAVDVMSEWVGSQPVEEMDLAPGRRNAVRLMNLHKAKGLEAPVVWLANPSGPGDFEPDRHIRRTGGAPRAHFRFQRSYGRAKRTVSHPVGWDESAAEERRYEQAEENRLMYVAATRARDLLVVSAYAGDLGERKAWGPLEAGLREIEELPENCFKEADPAPPPASRGPKAAVIGPAQLAQARQALMRKRAAASTAGEIHETVTSVARRDREPPEWARGGLGTWGSEVHLMLKALGETWPRRAGGEAAFVPGMERLLRLARAALAVTERGPADAERLAGLVSDIIRSGFWLRAMRVERRLFEVPFMIKVGPGDPGHGDLAGRAGLVPPAGGRAVVPAPGAPVLLSGAVDLVFREDDGWVLADYKTDRLPEALAAGTDDDREKALAILVDHYRPQVELYTGFWERLTGEKVKEAGLYFTALDRWVPVGRT